MQNAGTGSLSIFDETENIAQNMRLRSMQNEEKNANEDGYYNQMQASQVQVAPQPNYSNLYQPNAVYEQPPPPMHVQQYPVNPTYANNNYAQNVPQPPVRQYAAAQQYHRQPRALPTFVSQQGSPQRFQRRPSQQKIINRGYPKRFPRVYSGYDESRAGSVALSIDDDDGLLDDEEIGNDEEEDIEDSVSSHHSVNEGPDSLQQRYRQRYPSVPRTRWEQNEYNQRMQRLEQERNQR